MDRSFTVLTFDPSFTHWGWAVLRNDQVIGSGCIKTEPYSKKLRIRKGDDDTRRINEIAQKLKTIIDKNNVSYLLSELPHGSKNASAMKAIGIVMGIGQTISTFTNLSIEWYSQNDTKNYVLGKSQGTKTEMKKAIDKLYNVSWTGHICYDEHIADALAVYHTAKGNSPTLHFLTS